MSASHLAGNRNSTPEASNTNLRLPSSRSIAANHALRASADMGAYSPSPLSNRGLRPSSEVYFSHTQSGNPDEMERAAQQWIADIDQYEDTLEEMAAATLDQDFKDELSAIEQWFRVLSEAERTAALYALLQQTTQVQIRFFIQVLQQMAKSHPMSGVLSPANFGERDPMSQKLNDAMSKLNVDSSRNSVGVVGRPPPSPGAGAKRNSQLDPSTINSMFPDAAAAIAKQKAEFTQHTGVPPSSNRNSVIDRSSLAVPNVAPEDTRKENLPQPPASPWGRNTDSQQSGVRPKSSSSQQPMGQFAQPPPSAGLRSPRPQGVSGDSNIQNTTLSAADSTVGGMPGILSPYAGSGNWASMVNTPLVPNFQAQGNHTDMVANATAMKLAALSTVNNRIQLDDVRKYRRTRSTEGQGGLAPNTGGFPNAGMVMRDQLGQILSPQQAAALQAQQLVALQGQRSRPNSPGIAMQGGIPGVNLTSPQNNGYLAAYDNHNVPGINLSQYGLAVPGGYEGYVSDHSEMQRGRSPRGRRGSSKPPEDPTDVQLLEDIPSWLRTLRLHKYTDNLKSMHWTEMVELKDEDLEKRGVAAVGARRKMLKVFEDVLKKKSEGRYDMYLGNQ
ncbi:hypothetical protein EJ05DRAFT_493142 [Pseudovirgaria hyperparasitica]|uniref:RNA-binding protein VTS1 n=1 Tax=Pseudovirgaria hyperparasitica TaxID=470096 RepID=A0A6A6W8D2_9PEZI|nr:uncharacterized protein EJ05DRAFT_493142 [Pseudovirgaria hyperparasitica]KAF2758284.1 hypothetical protein EJ05DRAFT_493142 [Pseudovirgaria hyperparasitica]